MVIDLRCCVYALQPLNFPFQLGNPAPRLIEASDFLLRFLWQVCKLAQHPTNRLRRRRRGEQMTFARSRMRGANLV